MNRGRTRRGGGVSTHIGDPHSLEGVIDCLIEGGEGDGGDRVGGVRTVALEKDAVKVFNCHAGVIHQVGGD